MGLFGTIMVLCFTNGENTSLYSSVILIYLPTTRRVPDKLTGGVPG